MIEIGQKSFPQVFRQEGLARKVIIIRRLLTYLHHEMLDFQYCTFVLTLVTSSAVVSYIFFFADGW
jgi:hypothetical protein